MREGARLPSLFVCSYFDIRCHFSTTAAMNLKHYVKGRNEHRNTTAPIASAYGLEN